MGLLAIIWMGIFAGLIAGSILGIVYMSKSLLKMEWFFIGLINALIAILHLTVFWIIKDVLLWLVKKITGKEIKHDFTGEAVIVFTIFYLIGAWYNAHNVQQTSYVISTEKNVAGIKLAVFGDAHMDSTFNADKFNDYINEINAQGVDAVLNVGDFIDDDTSYDEMVKACAELGKIEAKYGVFYVEGNHDKGYYASHRGYTMEEVKKELIKNNVKVLEDEVHEVDGYCFVGRKDASYKDRKSIGELTKNIDKSKYIIVLDHQPKQYSDEVEAESDLVVSGHTHAGQLFPFNKTGAFLGVDDMDYGLKTEGNTNFIVTSGISNWAIKFRTGCVAEYVIIKVKNNQMSTVLE